MSQKLASKGILIGAISGKIMRQNEKVLAQVFKVFRREILFVLGARFGGGYARKLSPIDQYSSLLSPVGVWSVSQYQCGG